jgi:hypothetical protein
MKAKILLLGAVAMAAMPSAAFANPPSQATNSQGFNHSNGPTSTGQPSQDCEALTASGDGATPGNSSTAPGSAFNPDGTAGSVYAGEQPQNSRNSASVSQYDTACANQQPN